MPEVERDRMNIRDNVMVAKVNAIIVFHMLCLHNKFWSAFHFVVVCIS